MKWRTLPVLTASEPKRKPGHVHTAERERESAQTEARHVHTAERERESFL